MIIKSYSKINLSLRILKKIKNGLHNIQSNVFLLSLCDYISIKKINSSRDIIMFKGQFKKLVNKHDNSVQKILKILRLKKIISQRYKITVNKKIPVFSGLGGGTSNAASLLKFFLKTKNINKNIIESAEKKIGSDLRLFFNKQSYQKSLLKITKYKKKYNFNILIVYPNIKCSTKDIYSRVKEYSLPSKIDYSKIKSSTKFINFIKKDKNDLQKIAIKKFSILKNIIDFISTQKNCTIARMTGSGSACFGVFKNNKSAKLALNRVKRKFPKYWCVVTKTI